MRKSLHLHNSFLHCAQLCSKTTITADPEFTENRMTLNGKDENFENERIQRCLAEIKSRAAQSESCSRDLLEWKIHVVSENNFPTAAGLASSASGYACLVYSLAQLYSIKKQEISDIARLGSGSACRSIYGGFVQWQRGVQNDGKDSIAYQVAPASHWPDLHVLILVVNDAKKKVGSTSGMARSVVTSELIKYRVEKCVPHRIHSITQAIKDRDFPKFAEVTMKDSNQFHAICLDTYPPCVYMNDTSHAIVNYVHMFNKLEGETKIAYTFDAGPNACLYLLEKDVKRALSFINYIFPNDNQNSQEYVRGITVDFPQEVCYYLEDETRAGLFSFTININLFLSIKSRNLLILFHSIRMLLNISSTQKSVKVHKKSNNWKKETNRRTK
jgi:diphosphomevalonate decarboxylase